MSKTDPSRSLLIGFALALGVVVSVGERAVFAASLGREIDLSEIDVLTMNMVLVAIPFLALALRSSKRLAPWAFALAATVGLRWWWLAKGIAYQRGPDGSGVDMFGALLMLLSPFAITAVALVIDRIVQRRSKGS
ncbi:hypothetical protein [Sphingomonas hylomeconis]|uniref:Uncharacterized protein n=1 Tax=Sphingomonas hylomeconis TaxID=1395958 RepID=A0ABV7T2P9_9SPHN|nr:hypothetical protein [Sphingomonas hylomeconis]